MASSTFCPVGVFGALAAADEILGPNRTWRGRTGVQKQFLQLFGRARDLLDNVSGLQTWANHSHEALNRILAEAGFDIQLGPLNSELKEFGTVAIFKRVVEWLKKGSVTDIQIQGAHYPAFKVIAGVRVVVSRDGQCHVDLETKSGDRVVVVRHDNECEGLDLLRAAAEAMSRLKSGQSGNYAGAIIPMVDLDHQPDISFMRGLQSEDSAGLVAIIAQALQQNKLQMDEIGARVESATALGMLRGLPPQPYVVDGPFLFILVRDDMINFVARVDVDAMKRPPRSDSDNAENDEPPDESFDVFVR